MDEKVDEILRMMDTEPFGVANFIVCSLYSLASCKSCSTTI